jgi:hypothetical protein
MDIHFYCLFSHISFPKGQVPMRSIKARVLVAATGIAAIAAVSQTGFSVVLGSLTGW